jgi:alpha-beta hydrolase superfamily lysophospholipase
MVNKNIKDGFFINGKDGKEIYVYCWDKVLTPKAVIQIFHGMAEHAGRYKEFAQFLNSQGFIVYADDHRGHGKTAGSIEKLGYIGEDGFNKIVEDEHIISELIKEKHKGLPIVVFGHSFGSFIAQEYIIRYAHIISGVILSGSALRKGIDVHAGIAVSYVEKSIFSENKKSKLLDFLSFYNYNKKIKNSKSKFDWLSTDYEEIKKYEEDPLCGTVFTTGFYYYFLKGLTKLYKKDRLSKIPKKLPIFIISGEEDPVGNYGAWVKKLYNNYKDIEMKNVTLKLYHGKRHEQLNETSKYETFTDIVSWINEIFL